MSELSKTEEVFEQHGYIVSKSQRYNENLLHDIDLPTYLKHNPELDNAISRHFRTQFATAAETATDTCPVCGAKDLAESTLIVTGLPNMYICCMCGIPFADFVKIRAKYKTTVILITGALEILASSKKMIPIIDMKKIAMACSVYDNASLGDG